MRISLDTARVMSFKFECSAGYANKLIYRNGYENKLGISWDIVFALSIRFGCSVGYAYKFRNGVG